MKLLNKMVLLGIAALLGVCSASTVVSAMGSDPSGPTPVSAEKSKSEAKAVAASSPGVNVKGESGDFNAYVNDGLFPTEEEIRLMDVDPDSRVVLGGNEEASGVAYKKSYSKSPIAE